MTINLLLQIGLTQTQQYKCTVCPYSLAQGISTLPSLPSTLAHLTCRYIVPSTQHLPAAKKKGEKIIIQLKIRKRQ